jgi:oxygen-independent coproporphyrinogen-3 oxidase
LRRGAGIDRREFRPQTSTDLDVLIGRELTPLVEQGLLTDDGNSVRLSRRGKCVADGVIAQLMK